MEEKDQINRKLWALYWLGHALVETLLRFIPHQSSASIEMRLADLKESFKPPKL